MRFLNKLDRLRSSLPRNHIVRFENVNILEHFWNCQHCCHHHPEITQGKKVVSIDRCFQLFPSLAWHFLWILMVFDDSIIIFNGFEWFGYDFSLFYMIFNGFTLLLWAGMVDFGWICTIYFSKMSKQKAQKNSKTHQIHGQNLICQIQNVEKIHAHLSEGAPARQTPI